MLNDMHISFTIAKTTKDKIISLDFRKINWFGALRLSDLGSDI